MQFNVNTQDGYCPGSVRHVMMSASTGLGGMSYSAASRVLTLLFSICMGLFMNVLSQGVLLSKLAIIHCEIVLD